MKVAFDTSVLVAGSLADHPHEARARVWLDAARDRTIEAVTTTHALAELWATLTSLPVEPRIEAAQIDRLVARLRQHVRPQPLSRTDYTAAMARCSSRGLRSGAVYDALHLVAAERVQADVFLTFNTRDFVRLAEGVGPRVLAPPDPPAVVIG